MGSGLFEQHNSHCKYSGKLFVSLLFPVYSRLEPYHGFPYQLKSHGSLNTQHLGRNTLPKILKLIEVIFLFIFLSFSQNCVWLKNELAFNCAFYVLFRMLSKKINTFTMLLLHVHFDLLVLLKMSLPIAECLHLG